MTVVTGKATVNVLYITGIFETVYGITKAMNTIIYEIFLQRWQVNQVSTVRPGFMNDDIGMCKDPGSRFPQYK